MPITNAYMAEWAGEYQWTAQGIPIDLYTLVEDNVAAIPALEGWHLAHFRAGGRSIALLTCRVPRPMSLPGRPGVAYHHALITDEQTDSTALEEALRARYRDPVEFTRELYDSIAQEAGATRNFHNVVDAVRPLLDSVTVHSLPHTSSPNPVPPSDKSVVRLLRLNLALMVILILLGTYQTALLRKISAKVADENPVGDSTATFVVKDTTPSPAPADEFERTLQAGGVFMLDSLPSGRGFIENPRTQGLVADVQRFLGAHPELRVSVDVYADTMGSDAANQRTSTARANLLTELIRTGGGADVERLAVAGHGEAPTRTPPGKPPITSRERRIVVTASPLP